MRTGTVPHILLLCLSSAIVTVGIPCTSAAVTQTTGAQQAVIQPPAKVTIAFTIRVPETNEVIPETVAEYIAGDHDLIPAVEGALMGMKADEHKRLELTPDEAFGRNEESRLVRVRRHFVPTDAQAGSIYHDGDGRPYQVVALKGDTAIVDYNHPLAGKHLVVDVTIRRVEPLSPTSPYHEGQVPWLHSSRIHYLP